jgi:HlyD family secretion protein
MRRSALVLLLSLLLVLIVAGYFLTNPEQGQQLLVDLELATPVAPGYTTSGILEVQFLFLAAEYSGRVVSLPIAEGQTVGLDETVVQLETSLLETERDVAQARLDGVQAQLEMLQAGPRKVDRAIAQAVIDQAETILDGALQALEDAKESLPRRLRDEQVALAQAEVDRARSSLDAAEISLEALEKGPGSSEVAVVSAAVDGAEAKLASLEDQIANGEIRSPIEGVLLERFILPGELALAGQPIVSLADLSQVELTSFVPQADLGWVHVGDEVQIRVDAYPQRIFTGSVLTISNQAEYTPRNVQTPEERVILVYEVRILVPNQEGYLKPGLPSDVTFGVEP